MESVVKDLPNLSVYENLVHVPHFLTAALVVVSTVILVARYYPEKFGGESLNQWYDSFGLEGVTANLSILVLGFMITQYLYTVYVEPMVGGWKPVYFVLLFLVVQILHDILFYYAVVKPLPKGMNDMIDVCKKYVDENGVSVITANSLVVIVATGITFALESAPMAVAVVIAALAAYSIPFGINTKTQGTYRWVSPEEKAKQEEKAKEKVQEKKEITPWDLLKPQVQQRGAQSSTLLD